MYVHGLSADLQILIQDHGLASALCPGMLGCCEELGLSGAGLC